MKRRIVRCRLCGEKFYWDSEKYQLEDRQGAVLYDWDWISPDGPFFAVRGRKYGLVCPYCAESFHYYASSIVICLPERHNPITIKVLDGVAFDPDENFGSLPKDVENAVLKIARSLSWTSVDPWRGFYAPKYKGNGWVLAYDGWHSSCEDSDFSEKANRIMKNPFVIDFPVIFVICPTSNVFSLSVSVFVRRKDAEKLFELFGDTYSFGMRRVANAASA